MTNTDNYGIHTTDEIDYRKLYAETIKDLAQYNQASEVMGFPGIFKQTSKERLKLYYDQIGFVKMAEGDKPDWQKYAYAERYMPMDIYGVGAAFTDEFFQDADPEEINAWREEVMRADQKLLSKIFFWATLGGDSSGSKLGYWSGSTTDWNGTTLTGAYATPPNYKNNSFSSTHNHYNYHTSTNLDLTLFENAKSHLVEHGYGLNNKLVMFVNHTEAATIANMADWTTAMTANNVVDNIAQYGVRSKVDTINGFTIVIDDWVPDNYYYAMATDAEIVGIRSPKAGGGLLFYPGPYAQMPFKDSYFKRRTGMATGIKGAGTVTYIGSSSAYTSASSNFTFER